jgi:CYTH domain-containing protein
MNQNHVEIERKFLLLSGDWKKDVFASFEIAQGYLLKEGGKTVRIRTRGTQGFITIKGKAPTEDPLAVPEFEYEIPHVDALALLKLCGDDLITKTRHLVQNGPHVFEIDVFKGANEGLIVAEIELSASDENFIHPAWLGEEVTFDKRYKNARLVTHPYKNWDKPAPAKLKP